MRRLAITLAALCACSLWSPRGALAAAEDDMAVRERLGRLAQVNVAVDAKLINASQRKLVRELVAAARQMDEIFLRQVYSDNVRLQKRLADAKGSRPLMYEYFLLNFGPFDRLSHDEPFVPGVGPKPEGANFYPEDMTREEFSSWLEENPDDREAFESNFTVIRRREGGLAAVPYSEEYRELLLPAATRLRRAAGLTRNASLKRFLKSRAQALLSNDYFQSDVDWVRLEDHDIEVVIGPYEVYEDKLFGYKAAFEAFVTRVDPKESRRLAEVVEYLDELEHNLPIPDKHKGRGRSLRSPIVVAQLIYSAGDTKAGVQTLAFNLPNDERVRKQEGSKKVMLKNVQQAKFDKILVPIADRVLKVEDAGDVDFEAFFAHTLLHEISHGIGPGEIKKAKRQSTVSKELKDLYSIIEECKADALGVYNAIYLTGKGLYPASFMRSAWPTYLAGIFRSVRFGTGEAHGGGNAIQFNFLSEKGGISYDKGTGLFSVDAGKIEGAVRELVREVLMIEANGDYAAAKRFVKKYRKVPKELKGALAKLADVPVDIRPKYAYK